MTESKQPPPQQSPFEQGAALIKEHLKTMPTRPGVYRMLGADGTPLYVGKAKDLKKRVTAYTQQSRLPDRIQRMVARTRDMEIVVTQTEAEALLLEANLIQRFSPPYNVLFRDDKSYPYILITKDHEFPRLTKHRGARRIDGSYFGPFASGSAVDETMTILQKVFQIRTCADPMFALRKRPCLQYHIKRCTAPCVGKVSEKAYAAQVQDALLFLSGKSQAIQKNLAKQMQESSDAQDYETAAMLRDRIKLLTQTQSKQDIFIEGLGDADVIALHQAGGRSAFQIFFYRAGRNYGTRSLFATHEDKDPTPKATLMASFLAQFYADKIAPPEILLSDCPEDPDTLAKALGVTAQRKVTLTVPTRGDKKRLIDAAQDNAQEALARKVSETAEQTKLLAQVAELFHLKKPPTRIEVYDNSHISGKHAIGAMIAAGAEGFLKKTYRKFTIRDEAVMGDDFGMMTEVLTRRFMRLKKEDPTRSSGLWPDLLLIDGGAGQLSRVCAVLEEEGIDDIPIVAIAKGVDRNAGRERFFLPNQAPFDLPPQDPVLYYLQRLRDEAHRYAIGTHRARRGKALTESSLDTVDGIGASRKKALLRHFGSAEAVKTARIDDLTKVSGINAALAQKIYDSFHK